MTSQKSPKLAQNLASTDGLTRSIPLPASIKTAQDEAALSRAIADNPLPSYLPSTSVILRGPDGRLLESDFPSYSFDPPNLSPNPPLARPLGSTPPAPASYPAGAQLEAATSTASLHTKLGALRKTALARGDKRCAAFISAAGPGSTTASSTRSSSRRRRRSAGRSRTSGGSSMTRPSARSKFSPLALSLTPPTSSAMPTSSTPSTPAPSMPASSSRPRRYRTGPFPLSRTSRRLGHPVRSRKRRR